MTSPNVNTPDLVSLTGDEYSNLDAFERASLLKKMVLEAIAAGRDIIFPIQQIILAEKYEQVMKKNKVSR